MDSGSDVAAGLEALRARYADCRRCPELAASRRRVVFADGDPGSPLMLVGEGPGEDEDRTGIPFVGAAGQKLNKALACLGLDRRRVYLTNVVLCRPPANREPRPDECEACRARLDEQIAIVRPRALLALGTPAGRVLLGDPEYRVTRRRGEWGAYGGIPVTGTFHPSYFLFREGEVRRLAGNSPARQAKLRELLRDQRSFLADIRAAAARAERLESEES